MSELTDRLRALARAEHDDLGIANKAADELDEYDQLFEMQRAADLRGVELWRAAHPGNDLVLPDRARLCEWLIDQMAPLPTLLEHIEKQEAALQRIRAWVIVQKIETLTPPSVDTLKLAHEVLQANGISIDALRAAWARHILDDITDTIEGALR